LLFQTKNIIYVWGEIDELTKFTEFNLFTYDQIYLSHNINLQGEFKLYWHKHHPHIPTSSTNNQKCICEACIGIQENNPWSIQAATAYELHKWLDKRHTCSPFDIGLDPKLVKLNSNELQYRQLITLYAANDSITNNNLELMLFDTNEQNEQELIDEQQVKITSSTTTLTTHYEFQTPSYNNNEQLQQTPPVEPNLVTIESQQRSRQLTKEEKHKIHNRSCTLKQRKRYYQHGIKCRNIDKRFTIRNIKDILRQHRISFTAINFSTSSTAHERTLHIGVKDISKLETYEIQIQNLFTREHYKQFQYKKREIYHHTIRHYHKNNHHRRHTSNE
ncbi:unnamed protein product, partial [Rotaria sordida]